MEEQYYRDRVHLHHLMQTQPAWSTRQYAEATGRSLGWVKKWKARLRAAPDDPQVLRGRARRAHHLRAPFHPEVVQRILALRDTLPHQLGRVAGPLAIRYYLHADEALLAAGHRLPRSSRTLWRILCQHGRIHTPAPHLPQPWPAQEPLQSWQFDFKDVRTVPPDPEGKRQHVVEALNVVDEGSSLVMGAVVRGDFTSETALLALAHVLEARGVPRQVTFDRDPRFVGSWSGRDFPTPFVRFWMTLGVQVVVCPPQRPDRNAFVERYHRAYDEECLRQDWPTDLASAQAATARYVQFYNHDRPHQGRRCANQPPARALAAHPALAQLPALPTEVDPDAWLRQIQGRAYPRRLDANGSFQLDGRTYYVKAALAKHTVLAQLDAFAREVVVYHGGQLLKRCALRGLYGQSMAWADYLQAIALEARSHWATLLYHQRRRRALANPA